MRQLGAGARARCVAPARRSRRSTSCATCEIRQDLSAISGWPTIPQVFVKGELIGGADIVEELERSGELEQTLVANARRELLRTRAASRSSRCRVGSRRRARRSTSSACVAGLTLRKTFLTMPSAPITNVERTTPKYLRP